MQTHYADDILAFAEAYDSYAEDLFLDTAPAEPVIGHAPYPGVDRD